MKKQFRITPGTAYNYSLQNSGDGCNCEVCTCETCTCGSTCYCGQ